MQKHQTRRRAESLVKSLAMSVLTACAAFAGSAGLAVGAAEKPVPDTTWSGTVTHVTDGDTLWVRAASGGKPVRIRIDGVDAPEICQIYGPIARKALSARLSKQAVIVQALRRDSFGRLLARVTVVKAASVGAKDQLKGSADVGEWLVREGHAWSYRYRRDNGPYAQQQAAARAARKGLFATPHPEEPRDFRKRNGACANAGSGDPK